MARANANMVDRYVGIKLKRRRLEMGYSQDELGRFVGLTFQQIQKYEQGINQVHASTLYEFAKLLKVRVSYFFDNYEIFAVCMDYINSQNILNKSRIVYDVGCFIDGYSNIKSTAMKKALQDIVSKYRKSV